MTGKSIPYKYCLFCLPQEVRSRHRRSSAFWTFFHARFRFFCFCSYFCFHNTSLAPKTSFQNLHCDSNMVAMKIATYDFRVTAAGVSSNRSANPALRHVKPVPQPWSPLLKVPNASWKLLIHQPLFRRHVVWFFFQDLYNSSKGPLHRKQKLMWSIAQKMLI